MQALAGQASFAASLLAGEMPPNIEQAFPPAAAQPGGGSEPSQEVRSTLPPDLLLQGLCRALADLPARPLEDCLDLFWGAPAGSVHDKTPPGAAGTTARGLALPATPPAVQAPVLQFLGPAPAEAGGRNLAEVLAELYAAVTRFAVEESMTGEYPDT